MKEHEKLMINQRIVGYPMILANSYGIFVDKNDPDRFASIQEWELCTVDVFFCSTIQCS